MESRKEDFREILEKGGGKKEVNIAELSSLDKVNSSLSHFERLG